MGPTLREHEGNLWNLAVVHKAKFLGVDSMLQGSLIDKGIRTRDLSRGDAVKLEEIV